MDPNLFRVSEVCWAVVSSKESEPMVFNTIEGAADYLEVIGIPDQQIDNALVDMAANGTCRANFGATKGHFMFSDHLRMNELLGVA
jgi:hypothetical protein